MTRSDCTISNFILIIVVLFMDLRCFCRAKSKTLNYAIDEEKPVGTFIGNIIRDSGESVVVDLQIHSMDKNAELCLALAPKSGDVHTKVKIDREKVCTGRSESCQIEFAVQFSDQQWINVFVVVRDVNDHVPRFKKTRYQVSLLENTALGYVVQLESAYDPDAGPNGELVYRLIGGDRVFDLEEGGSRGVGLRVVAGLDYEILEMRNVNMTLEACDGGRGEALCSSALISVQLLDANDNAPVFERNVYEVLVNSSSGEGQQLPIVTLLARDADDGKNGRVRYSLASTVGEEARHGGGVFSVTPDTGQLRLQGRLVSGGDGVVELKIVAEDGGQPPLQASCTVRVKVAETNSYPPEIMARDGGNFSVAENQPTGTEVGVVYVLDRDNGDNGWVDCRLQQQQGSSDDSLRLQLGNIIRKTRLYTLTTTHALDRESEAALGAVMLCWDRGESPQTASVSITVVVRDENEFEPEFMQQRDTVIIEVPEDTRVGVSLIWMEAKDRDEDSTLTYSLLTNEGNIEFDVQPHTGWLRTRTGLDREKKALYQLTVVASDGHFKASAAVAVRVTDCNDNAPRLDTTELSVAEGVGQGLMTGGPMAVGRLRASDPDLGENGTVKFFLTRIRTGKGEIVSSLMFSLDANTGQLASLAPLDRETVPEYRLTIRLLDSGRSPLATDTTLSLRLLDRNDNAPHWLPFIAASSSSSSHLNVTLPLLDPSRALLRLAASDPDSEANANLSYRLLTATEVVRLHSHSGHLYGTSQLREGIVELAFQVTDSLTLQIDFL